LLRSHNDEDESNLKGLSGQSFPGYRMSREMGRSIFEKWQ